MKEYHAVNEFRKIGFRKLLPIIAVILIFYSVLIIAWLINGAHAPFMLLLMLLIPIAVIYVTFRRLSDRLKDGGTKLIISGSGLEIHGTSNKQVIWSDIKSVRMRGTSKTCTIQIRTKSSLPISLFGYEKMQEIFEDIKKNLPNVQSKSDSKLISLGIFSKLSGALIISQFLIAILIGKSVLLNANGIALGLMLALFFILERPISRIFPERRRSEIFVALIFGGASFATLVMMIISVFNH